MKTKLLTFLTIATLTLTFFVASALAAEVETSPRLLPDSPIYFLKTWMEEITLLFTFDQKAKTEKYVELANERVREAKFLALEGKTQAQGKTLEKYQSQLDSALSGAKKLQEQGKEIGDLLSRVTEATTQHQAVLAEVLEKAPEQAKKGLEQAISASQKGSLQALESISSDEKREELLNKVKESLPDAEKQVEELKSKFQLNESVEEKVKGLFNSP